MDSGMDSTAAEGGGDAMMCMNAAEAGACEMCVNMNCCAAWTACQGEPSTEAGYTACEEIQACVNQCVATSDAGADAGAVVVFTCKTQCESMTDAGVTDYEALFACAAASCSTVCE
jgi:hypothetical protein